jgi:FAD-dependent oxidoreductase domain-containing protein 1
LLSGDYDLVVIGAGILGASSAYHLKKNNPSKKILLLDRNPAAGQGNTARSNAMFRDTFSSKDNQILAKSSISYYSTLENIGLVKTGYLWLLSDDQSKKSEAILNSMQKNGIRISRFSKIELSAIPQLVISPQGEEADLINAPQIHEGCFGHDCGRLEPDRLTNHYVEKFSNLGGNVAYNAEVKKLVIGSKKDLGLGGEPFVWQEAEAKSITVLHGGSLGTINSKAFVIACGAWTNELLEPIGIDGHVKAKKRQLFKLRAEKGSKISSLLSVSPIHSGNLPFLILPKSACFVKAIPQNAEFWIGCDAEWGEPFINMPSKDIDLEYRASSEYYSLNIRPILNQYLPDLSSVVPSQMWAGLYSYNTVDYIPFAFQEGNVIAVGGDSGSGIMKGDSLGRIVASLYSGQDESELYGGTYYKTSKIGFTKRQVEREEWVL